MLTFTLLGNTSPNIKTMSSHGIGIQPMKRSLGSTNCMFLKNNNFLNCIKQKFTSEPLAEFIQFNYFTKSWNDKSMINNGIHYFLDDSVYYESENRQ